MRKSKYENLLARMYIIESLGECLYRGLCSKCADAELKSAYRTLARNEKETRECIEVEIASLGKTVPSRRTRIVTTAAWPIFKAMPRRWLHRFLIRLLRRRMFSRWRKKHGDRNAEFWTRLVEHEDLQYQLLGLSEK
jgi:hypothetical protein